jgi:hypothetical protein
MVNEEGGCQDIGWLYQGQVKGVSVWAGCI